MSRFLGIDTSNYSTSVAVISDDFSYSSDARLLYVPDGSRGLRQNDAVFDHIKNLPDMLSSVVSESYYAVGVSTSPRSVPGSYMPCFVVGKSFADVIANEKKIPVYNFSHQMGHIAAGLFSAGSLNMLSERFLAFHLSGGTMELLLVNGIHNISCVSQTADITAGQLFDRTGVKLGASFPAGKYISDLAVNGSSPIKYKIDVKNGSVNLSGVENKVDKLISDGVSQENIASFVADTVIDAIKKMIKYARSQFDVSLPVVMIGGVSSSVYLRENLRDINDLLFAAPEFSKDNALGIAVLTMLSYNGEI